MIDTRPLAAADLRSLAQQLERRARGPSEYSIPNLFLYRARHAYRLIPDTEGLLLGITYDGTRHALPLAELDRHLVYRALSIADCLYPIEEAEGSALCTKYGLVMEFDDADSDYIYDAAHLARLDQAPDKRRQAAAFASAAAPQLKPLTASSLGAARVVLDGWLDDVGQRAEATDLDECREALACLDILGLEGWIVWAGGEPVAFLLAGGVRGDQRTVHVAKGRRSYPGVYPWMFAQFADRCGTARLNFEQDLGKPGFAQAKRALAPIGRIRKYRVRREAP